LDAQGNTTAIFVDIQDHHFHFVADLYHFGRVDVLVGPVHFGNVNQAFHAFLDLGEAAVIGKVGNTRLDAGTFRVLLHDVVPRILAQLLEAQGDTHFLAVELEYLDFDFLAHFDDFAGMLDALPGHVGNVQQAIDAAQIHERTVVGQVLHDTLDHHAFLQGFQQSFALGGVFRFHDRAAGNHHVVALRIQLDDFEVQILAFQVGDIANRTDIHQGVWQERADRTDIHGETTFDLAGDLTFDDLVFVESHFQFAPAFGAIGFFPGKAGEPPAPS